MDPYSAARSRVMALRCDCTHRCVQICPRTDIALRVLIRNLGLPRSSSNNLLKGAGGRGGWTTDFRRTVLEGEGRTIRPV